MLQELLPHPQVWHETGKALGLNKEWFSESEGFDGQFKSTSVNIFDGKGKIL